ncbi:MAG: BamA/TamA family outer membrane protein [Armatimonadota bacterium]
MVYSVITGSIRAAGSRYKFNPIQTLAIRLKVGTSVEGLPFSEQYFIGGLSDLRGYREPRFCGRHFVVSNTQFRHLISRSIVLVGFVDIGDVSGSQYQFTSDADT